MNTPALDKIISKVREVNGSWEFGYLPKHELDSASAELATIKKSNTDLLAALEEPCRYHHLPLINGWAHSIDAGIMGEKKTIRCPLSEHARDAIAAAKGEGK